MKSRRCYCGRPLHSKRKNITDFPVAHEICDAYGCPYGYIKEVDDEWVYRITPESSYIRYYNRESSRSRSVDYNISVYKFFGQSLAKSSINGISNCVSTSNAFGKIIWFLVFCFCAAGFGYQASGFYGLYRSKPSVVQIEVENDGEVDFPAVTVCNTNRIRKNIFCKYFPEKCKEGPGTLTEYEINEILYGFMLEGKDDVKRELGHNKSMIINCEFIGKPSLNGEQCTEIWEYFYDPDYGNCYTFTAKTKNNEILQARKVDFWQEENELSVVIDLQTEEFMEKKRSSGVILVVHDLKNQPDIHTEGMQLIPGLSYAIGVAKSTVILLPLPYKTNCTDYLSLPWKKMHTNRLTSRDFLTGVSILIIPFVCACWKELVFVVVLYKMLQVPQLTCTVGCSQYFQLKNCKYVTKNISLFYEKLPYKKEDRTEERSKCAIEEEKMNIDYCRSICGLPCRDTIYTSNNGISKLSGNEKPILHAMAKRENPENRTLLSLLVHVRVFYSTLEHKIYRHIPKYNTMELFSYLGGYSGVWLGFSLLTVYELIEIIFSTTLFCFRKLIYQKQHKRIAGTVLNSRKNPRIYKKKRYF